MPLSFAAGAVAVAVAAAAAAAVSSVVTTVAIGAAPADDDRAKGFELGLELRGALGAGPCGEGRFRGLCARRYRREARGSCLGGGSDCRVCGRGASVRVGCGGPRRRGGIPLRPQLFQRDRARRARGFAPFERSSSRRRGVNSSCCLGRRRSRRDAPRLAGLGDQRRALVLPPLSRRQQGLLRLVVGAAEPGQDRAGLVELREELRVALVGRDGGAGELCRGALADGGDGRGKVAGFLLGRGVSFVFVLVVILVAIEVLALERSSNRVAFVIIPTDACRRCLLIVGAWLESAEASLRNSSSSAATSRAAASEAAADARAAAALACAAAVFASAASSAVAGSGAWESAPSSISVNAASAALAREVSASISSWYFLRSGVTVTGCCC